MTDPAAARPWRCFVAVPLPAELRAALGEWVAGVRRAAPQLETDWRWTDPEGWHITLAFLGATPAADVAAILERLSAGLAGRGAFTVAVGGFGAFPGRTRARVLWYGIQDPDGRLAEVAQLVRAATNKEGEAPFRPHVTLARARTRDRHGIAVPSLPVETLPAGEVPVNSVFLMRSHLGRGTARYESIGEVPLLSPAPTGAPA
jgi:2'-5' RNA ligase